MVDYYDRDKLYKEIWEDPITEVCKRYGVSDVALSKTCKKLKIPKPPVGYWAKKAAGKAPKKSRMYPYDNAPRLIINSLQAKTQKAIKPIIQTEPFIVVDEIIQKINTVPVCNDFENLDPYVRNTRKVFKRKIKKDWKDDYNRISVSGEDVFEINIGEDSIDRITVILQSICATMKTLDIGIVQTKYGASFKIMDKEVTVKLSESSKKQPITVKDPDKYYYRDYEYIPSGVLKLEINTDTFSMDDRKSWMDGKTKIEERLDAIIPQIIRSAAWKKEYIARRNKMHEEWRIEQERQAEKARLDRIDKKRIENLTAGFKVWLYHKDLTEYVISIKAHYISHNGEPEGDFAQWLKWGESYLEKINPLNGKYPKFDVSEDSSWLKSI